MAAQLQETPIRFIPSAPLPPQPSSNKNKAANAIRTNMMDALGVTNLYDLNRLHLQVDSTFDVSLQKKVTEFLHRLADPKMVSAYGMKKIWRYSRSWVARWSGTTRPALMTSFLPAAGCFTSRTSPRKIITESS